MLQLRSYIPRAVVLAAITAASSFARIGISNGAFAAGGQRLTVRGVAYAPPAGQPCLAARDLPLIAAAGANTVFVRGALSEAERAFLPLAESAGLYWLAGFPLDPYYDPSRTITAGRDRILEAFRAYVERFRGRSRLIGYAFGDGVTENYSSKFAGSPLDFYALVADAAAVLADVEAEAPPLLTTIARNAEELRREAPGLSFWTLAAGAADQALPETSTRPVLVLDAGAFLSGELPARFLGGVYAGFDELFQATAASVYPKALALTLVGRWGGRTPNGTAGFPGIEALEHAATGAAVASPGALVRVLGRGFTSGSEAASSNWPLAAGTTSLCLGNLPAPLGYVSEGALTAQVPWDLTPGEHDAVVFRDGVASKPLTVRIDRFAPGIFPGAAARAGTTCTVSAGNGVRPGEYLEVYGTGFGGGSASESGLEAFVNGTPAPVLFLGLVPGFAGLNQVNVQVKPETPPSIAASLFFRMDGVASNPYPLSVHGVTEKPGILLGAETTTVVLQAGGDPAVIPVRVEGANGYCGPVLFYSEQAPAGITFRVPVAFTGQTVPIEVRAASGISVEDGLLVLAAQAAGVSGARVAIRLSVLPNRGDVRVRVISGGYKSAPLSRLEWSGHTLFSTTGGGPGRGINVLAVNPTTGIFAPVASFDTWGDENASVRLASYLLGLPAGTIVLFSVADDGALLLAPDTRNVIAALFGSRFIGGLGYQESWAMIARKGAPAPIAEHRSTDSQVILERVLTLPVQ